MARVHEQSSQSPIISRLKARHQVSHPRFTTMRIATLVAAALVLVAPAVAAPVPISGKSYLPFVYTNSSAPSAWSNR